MKVTCPIKELTVTQRSLANALGLTAARVSQMVKEGIAIRNEDDKGGAVFLFESLRNYWASKSPGVQAEDSESVDYMEEKAKHEKAKREIAELKLAKMEASVYDAKTVELVMTEMLSNLRTQLLGIPTKMAPMLEEKTKEEIYQMLTEGIETSLSELSGYEPELFVEELELDAEEDS